MYIIGYTRWNWRKNGWINEVDYDSTRLYIQKYVRKKARKRMIWFDLLCSNGNCFIQRNCHIAFLLFVRMQPHIIIFALLFSLFVWNDNNIIIIHIHTYIWSIYMNIHAKCKNCTPHNWMWMVVNYDVTVAAKCVTRERCGIFTFYHKFWNHIKMQTEHHHVK